MADLTPFDDAVGKADQMVAQACAIAVQDATDNLRNLNIMCTTAIGVLIGNYVKTQNPIYLDMIKKVGDIALKGPPAFALTGAKAAEVLSHFKKI
ncbi:MAG: hypothetical protein ACFB10_15000 [Salibacteraceae bacterium]